MAVTKINFNQVKGAAANVLDYGAKADGITDDGAAFNAALTASDSVYVPAGIYLINTSITGTYAGKKLIGNAATLKTTITTNFNIIKLVSGGDSNEISGFKFQGVGVTDSVNPVIGIYIYQSDQNDIHDNTFTGLNYGVCLLDALPGVATNPKRNNIHHNLFLDAYGPTNGGYGVLNVRSAATQICNNIFAPGTFGRHCIYISAGTSYAIVAGNTCVGPTLAPITVNTGVGAGDEVTNCIITNNIVFGPGSTVANSHGISITGSFSFGIIANNQIDGAGQNGILIQAADGTHIPNRNIITNNRISNSSVEGLLIYDATNNLIMGNIFDRNNASGGTLSEMELTPASTASCTGNMIVNNVSGNSQNTIRHNVALSTGATQNIVQNNQFSGATQDAIYDAVVGANNILPLMGGIQTITYAATITPDPQLGEIIKCILTGGLTIENPSWAMEGQRVTFILTQDGTGGRTVSWGSLWDAVWSNTGNTLNAVACVSFIYDGVKYRQHGAQTPWH